MKGNEEFIIFLALAFLLVVLVFKGGAAWNKMMRASDRKKMGDKNSSRLLFKKGMVFDKSKNKIVADHEIII